MNCESKMTLIIVCCTKTKASKQQIRQRSSFLCIAMNIINYCKLKALSAARLLFDSFQGQKFKISVLALSQGVCRAVFLLKGPAEKKSGLTASMHLHYHIFISCIPTFLYHCWEGCLCTGPMQITQDNTPR